MFTPECHRLITSSGKAVSCHFAQSEITVSIGKANQNKKAEDLAVKIDCRTSLSLYVYTASVVAFSQVIAFSLFMCPLAIFERLERVVLRWNLAHEVITNHWHLCKDIVSDLWYFAEEEDGEDSCADTESCKAKADAICLLGGESHQIRDVLRSVGDIVLVCCISLDLKSPPSR